MPFKSEAQRKKFYAMYRRGEITKKTLLEWERETPQNIPKKVKKKKKTKEKKRSNRKSKNR